MDLDNLFELVKTEGFWGGVLASILATGIVTVLALIFRNSIRTLVEQRKKGRLEDELFDDALKLSSPYAPFAFGVVQGRALRYFLIAVFIAYIGDIMGLFWPINIVFYIFSLFYILQGLRWFYRIEKRAMEILDSKREP